MMKILIVDDSLLDRKLLSKTLVNGGVRNEILQAENGEVALNLIGQNIGQIAVLLCDYQMPNMSGLELISGLRKVSMTASIPIVMITASSAEDSKRAAYAANPDLAGYIIKPYKPDEVIAAIKPYAQF